MNDLVLMTEQKFMKEKNNRMKIMENRSDIEMSEMRNKKFVSDELFQTKKDMLKFEYDCHTMASPEDDNSTRLLENTTVTPHHMGKAHSKTITKT